MAKLKTQFNDLVSYEAPTPPTPMFSELVEVVAPASGIVDLTAHNGKRVFLDVSAVDNEATKLFLTIPDYIQVVWSGGNENVPNVRFTFDSKWEQYLMLRVDASITSTLAILDGKIEDFFGNFSQNILTKIAGFIFFNQLGEI